MAAGTLRPEQAHRGPQGEAQNQDPRQGDQTEFNSTPLPIAAGGSSKGNGVKRLRTNGSKTQIELPVAAFRAKGEDTNTRGATAEAQSRAPAAWLLDRQISRGKKPTCAVCAMKMTQGHWKTIKQNEKTGGRWAHTKCVNGGYRDDDTVLLSNPVGKNSIEEILTDLQMKTPNTHRTLFVGEEDLNDDANMTPASQIIIPDDQDGDVGMTLNPNKAPQPRATRLPRLGRTRANR